MIDPEINLYIWEKLTYDIKDFDKKLGAEPFSSKICSKSKLRTAHVLSMAYPLLQPMTGIKPINMKS